MILIFIINCFVKCPPTARRIYAKQELQQNLEGTQLRKMQWRSVLLENQLVFIIY